MSSKKKRRVRALIGKGFSHEGAIQHLRERARHTIEVGPDDLVVVVSSRKVRTADGGEAVTPPLTKIMIGDRQVGLVSNFEIRASSETFAASVHFLKGLPAEAAAAMSPWLRTTLVRSMDLVSRCWFVESLPEPPRRQEPT